MKAQPNARVAVVTVSYGSEGVLAGFLASIRAAATSPLSVVVADNKPQATGSVESLAAEHDARYLPLANNPGYGGAMDAGVATLASTIEWVLISNPDIVLSPGAIDAMVAVGSADEKIGAIGPVVLTPDGEVYPSARAIPSLRTGVGHALLANVWPSNPWTRAYRHDTEAAPRARAAGWLSGSCLLVRRTAFDAIGGFDPGYFMYFEDVDLGYRLGRSGWRSVYTPDATVTHAGAHSTDAESSAMITAHHRSAYRFMASKYRGWWLWPVRASLRVGLATRGWWLVRRVRNHR